MFLLLAFVLYTRDRWSSVVEHSGAAAGAAGVLTLVRGMALRRWLAATAGWIGSAAMLSWGCGPL